MNYIKNKREIKYVNDIKEVILNNYMDKLQVKNLPLKDKLDLFTLKALNNIQKTRYETLKLCEQKDFKNWLLHNNNLFKVNLFIWKLKDALSSHNKRIVDEKGFKNMIASILYRNST